MSQDRNARMPASNICIGGKRISEMRELASATFGEALMYVEVDIANRIFIVHVNDSAGNGIDIDKLVKFKDKYKLCAVKVYQCIDILSQKGK